VKQVAGGASPVEDVEAEPRAASGDGCHRDAGPGGREQVLDHLVGEGADAERGDQVAPGRKQQRALSSRGRVRGEHAVDGAVEHAEAARRGEQAVRDVPGGDDRGPLRRGEPRHRRRRRAVLLRPPLAQHDLWQRLAARPPGPLESRSGRPLVRPAEAQPAEGDDAVRGGRAA
jgi:hypothetical protein